MFRSYKKRDLPNLVAASKQVVCGRVQGIIVGLVVLARTIIAQISLSLSLSFSHSLALFLFFFLYIYLSLTHQSAK